MVPRPRLAPIAWPTRCAACPKRRWWAFADVVSDLARMARPVAPALCHAGQVGRDEVALSEHEAIVAAIAARDGEAAHAALRAHISKAYETRLRVDAGELKLR